MNRLLPLGRASTRQSSGYVSPFIPAASRALKNDTRKPSGLARFWWGKPKCFYEACSSAAGFGIKVPAQKYGCATRSQARSNFSLGPTGSCPRPRH